MRSYLLALITTVFLALSASATTRCPTIQTGAAAVNTSCQLDAGPIMDFPATAALLYNCTSSGGYVCPSADASQIRLNRDTSGLATLLFLCTPATCNLTAGQSYTQTVTFNAELSNFFAARLNGSSPCVPITSSSNCWGITGDATITASLVLTGQHSGIVITNTNTCTISGCVNGGPASKYPADTYIGVLTLTASGGISGSVSINSYGYHFILTGSTNVQASGSQSIANCGGGPPVYCARTDTAFNTPASAPPSGFFTTTPLTGSGNLFYDPDFDGATLRVTDFTDTQTSGTAERKYRSPSASEQNPWMSDDCGFWAIQLGNNAIVYGFSPVLMMMTTAPCGSTPTLAPLTGQSSGVSTATVTAGTLTFSPDTNDWGYQQADNRSIFAWGIVDNTAPNDGLYKVDLVSGTPYTFGGTGHNTKLMAMSGATGLTYTHVITSSGAAGNDIVNKYFSFNLDGGTARSDTVSVDSLGYQADNIPYVVIWKNGSGARWIDTRTGTTGGQWGASGAWNTNSGFGPLAAPTSSAWGASNVTGTNNGSSGLTATDTFKLCVTYTEINVGESPCGPTITATPGMGNNAFTITSPANVSGAAPKYTIATGYNIYACDKTTETSGCTPHLQADISVQNSTTPLPTVTTACNANCTGITFSVNYQAVAINGNYKSAPSAATAVTTGATGLAQYNLTATVSNAGSFPSNNFDILRDDPTQRLTTGASPQTDSGTSLNTYIDETVKIGTSMTFGYENTTTQAAPTISSAGWLIHNAKLDSTGNWLRLDSSQALPNRVNNNPDALLIYLGDTNANTVFTCGRGVNNLGDITDGCGSHLALGSAVSSGRIAYPGCSNSAPPNISQSYLPLQSTGNYSTDLADMNADQVLVEQTGYQNVSPYSCNNRDDQHFSWNDNWAANGNGNANPLIGALYPDNPYTANPSTIPFQGEIVGLQTSVPGLTPTAHLATYRFGRDWTAALSSTSSSANASDFNKTARGNLSISGNFYLFTSSMLAGSGLVNNDSTTIPNNFGVGCSGSSGSNAGSHSDYCKVSAAGNTNSIYPREDVFIRRIK